MLPNTKIKHPFIIARILVFIAASVFVLLFYCFMPFHSGQYPLRSFFACVAFFILAAFLVHVANELPYMLWAQILATIVIVVLAVAPSIILFIETKSTSRYAWLWMAIVLALGGFSLVFQRPKDIEYVAAPDHEHARGPRA